MPVAEERKEISNKTPSLSLRLRSLHINPGAHVYTSCPGFVRSVSGGCPVFVRCQSGGNWAEFPA
jgi:hypothetical protein